MGYQREFDPEIGDEALRACVNDGALGSASSYALAVNPTTSSAVVVPAGVYRVFLKGMSASETVAVLTGSAGVSASLPSAGSPALSAVFPGNEVVRVRVQPDGTSVAAITATASGMLFLVPVLRL